jgi:hypothetical protein
MAEPTITVPVPEGATLEEALRRWCDPAAVAEMERLADEGYDGPNVWILGEVTEYEVKVSRYQELRRQLETELMDKLRRGELAATGYDMRLALDAKPVVLSADRWRVLAPDFERSAARTGAVEVSGIRVTERARAGHPEPKRKAGRYSPADVEAWYRQYTAELAEQDGHHATTTSALPKRSSPVSPAI